jgi:hypothetical protein
MSFHGGVGVVGILGVSLSVRRLWLFLFERGENGKV